MHTDKETFDSNRGMILEELDRKGVIKVVVCDKAPTCKAMLWRLKPMFDPEVELFVCRDMDSLSTPKDRICVEEWVASPFLIHGINDNRVHTVPLMGGMCGFRTMPVRVECGLNTWEEMCKVGGHDTDEYWNGVGGPDQNHLDYCFWNRLRGQGMVHILKGEHTHGGCAETRRGYRRDTGLFSEEVQNEGDALAPFLGAPGVHVPPEQVLTFCAKHLPMEVENAVVDATAQPKNFALFACDSNKIYAFFAPMTARLWQRIGYGVAVILVGSQSQWEENEALRLALEEMRRMRVRRYWLPELGGHRTSTLAQTSRIYAGALPEFRETDFIITGDADMWPLSQSFFGVADPTKFYIAYSNAYGPAPDGVQHYPICYIGAPHKLWQDMMRVKPGTFVESVQKQLDEGLGKNNADGWACWNYDERLVGIRITEWIADPAVKAKVVFNTRYGGPPVDRVDRCAWPEGMIDVSQKSDAHMPRNHLFTRCLNLLKSMGVPDVAWYEKFMQDFFVKAKWNTDNGFWL